MPKYLYLWQWKQLSRSSGWSLKNQIDQYLRLTLQSWRKLAKKVVLVLSRPRTQLTRLSLYRGSILNYARPKMQPSLVTPKTHSKGIYTAVRKMMKKPDRNTNKWWMKTSKIVGVTIVLIVLKWQLPSKKLGLRQSIIATKCKTLQLYCPKESKSQNRNRNLFILL